MSQRNSSVNKLTKGFQWEILKSNFCKVSPSFCLFVITFFSSLNLVWFYLTHIQIQSPLPPSPLYHRTSACASSSCYLLVYKIDYSAISSPRLFLPAACNENPMLLKRRLRYRRDSQLIPCSVLGNNGPPASIFYISVSDILFSTVFLLSLSLATPSSTAKLFTLVRSCQRIPLSSWMEKAFQSTLPKFVKGTQKKMTKRKCKKRGLEVTHVEREVGGAFFFPPIKHTQVDD